MLLGWPRTAEGWHSSGLLSLCIKHILICTHHPSLILSLSSPVPAEGHNMAAFLRGALRVLTLYAACVNMAQQLIKTHIVSLHLYKREFESTLSVTEGLWHTISKTGWNIDGVFFSFLLYLRTQLERSAFLTLNIHCPVEYDQGSAKEDHFVTWEKEGGERWGPLSGIKQWVFPNRWKIGWQGYTE